MLTLKNRRWVSLHWKEIFIAICRSIIIIFLWDWTTSLRLPAYRDYVVSFVRVRLKLPTHFSVCGWEENAGRHTWGALHSLINPVTWIYDAVIYSILNASLIVGLLKVPEKRWKLSFATCETRALQALKWGVLRICKVCLCSMETAWTLWVLYVAVKGSGTSRLPARLHSILCFYARLCFEF